MAELGVAIAGLTLQGFHLVKQINDFRTTYQEVESTFQRVKNELRSAHALTERLEQVISDIEDSTSTASSCLLPNLAGFKFEIDMIADVYTALSKLLATYHEPRVDGLMMVLQPLNLMGVQMGLGKKLKWISRDRDQAKKLQQMLAGHKANLNFAIQAAQFSLQISEAQMRELSHDAMDQKINEVAALIQENQETLRQIQRASTPATPGTPTSMASFAAISEESLHRRVCELENRDAALTKREEQFKKKENTTKLIKILQEHLQSLEVRRRNSVTIDNLEISHVPLPISPSTSGPALATEDHANQDCFPPDSPYQEEINEDMRLYDLSRNRTTEAEIKRRTLVMILIVLDGLISTILTVWWRGYLVVNSFVWLVLFLGVMLVWILPEDGLSSDGANTLSSELRKRQ